MKACLAGGYTFGPGFAVHASFQKENWLSTGVMPVPSTTEPVLGGHAVLFFGYDDDRKAFQARKFLGTGMASGWKFLVPLPGGGRSQHSLGCVDATLGQTLAMVEARQAPRQRTS
jgi:hypothetical protein